MIYFSTFDDMMDEAGCSCGQPNVAKCPISKALVPVGPILARYRPFIRALIGLIPLITLATRGLKSIGFHYSCVQKTANRFLIIVFSRCNGEQVDYRPKNLS